MIDVSRLTLGEIDKIETLSGQSVSRLGEEDTPKGKMMAALAFITKRRQQMAAGEPPSYTWNEALALTMDEANEILGIGGDEDDEEPADSPEQPPVAENRAKRRAKGQRGPKAPEIAVLEPVDEPDPTTGD